MSGQRDFLKEIQELNAESDKKVAQVMANVAGMKSPFSGKGVFEQIMDELKTIRVEMKEIDRKNERKFEELKAEIETINNTNQEKLMDIELSLLKARVEVQTHDEKMSKLLLRTVTMDAPDNIRNDILGEWLMIDHENFEGYKKVIDGSYINFSDIVKFEMENGLLKTTGGSYKTSTEGGKEYGGEDLFVEGNHVKTITTINTIDRYIEDGKLHVVHHQEEHSWKRIYQKISTDVSGNIREKFVGWWKMVDHDNFEGYKKISPMSSFRVFSENVNYTLEDGLLKQTDGGYKDMKEGENEPGTLRLFVIDNHVRDTTCDRYIEDGRLHVNDRQGEVLWKRVYERVLTGVSGNSSDRGNSIKEKFVGWWKMVDHDNFDGFDSFAIFAENVKFELEDGLLKTTGGSYKATTEGGKQFGGEDLYVEGDHVKTISKFNSVDRYIKDGKLNVVHHEGGKISKRVYEKI